MDNREQYEVYRNKYQKQSFRLILASILSILLHLIFSVKLWNELVIKKTPVLPRSLFSFEMLSVMCIIMFILISSSLIYITVLSFIVFLKAKKGSTDRVKELMTSGKIMFGLSYGIYIASILLAVMVIIFVSIVTLFFGIGFAFEMFEDFFRLFKGFLAGCVPGIFWFLISVDVKNTVENFNFYSKYL